jgi:hypothetical protein
VRLPEPEPDHEHPSVDRTGRCMLDQRIQRFRGAHGQRFEIAERAGSKEPLWELVDGVTRTRYRQSEVVRVIEEVERKRSNHA